MGHREQGPVSAVGSPRKVVAAGTFTLVERCECGTVYLTIGPVCVKLMPDALPELHAVLGAAAAAMSSTNVEGTPEGTAECTADAGRELTGEEKPCRAN